MTVQPHLSQDAFPQRRIETRTRKYRGNLFVANAEQAFELDELGEFVFRLIDGRTSVRDIGRKLAESYGGPIEEAVADTAALIEELVEHQVLQLRTDS
jgi:coenzyme PQQ synthesis protein D (PqqD)